MRYAYFGIYRFVWISLLIFYIYCHPRFGLIYFTVSRVSFFTLIHGNNSSIRMDFLGGALIDRFVYVTNCYKFLVLSLSLSLLWGTVFFWQKNVCITMQKIDTIWRFSIPSWNIVNTTHHWLTNFLVLRRSCYFYSVCSVQKSPRYNFKETILFL